MAACEKLEKCPFFADKLEMMPAVSALMKTQYCLGDKSDCARYRVSTAGLPVPLDLFPNDSERARQLLATRK